MSGSPQSMPHLKKSARNIHSTSQCSPHWLFFAVEPALADTRYRGTLRKIRLGVRARYVIFRSLGHRVGKPPQNPFRGLCRHVAAQFARDAR